MKTLLIALSLLIFVSVTITAQVTNKSSKVESQKVWFSCPMHPHEMSLKEGECSVWYEISKNNESKICSQNERKSCIR